MNRVLRGLIMINALLLRTSSSSSFIIPTTRRLLATQQNRRYAHVKVETLLNNIPKHSNPKINQLVQQYLIDSTVSTPQTAVLPSSEGKGRSVVNRVFCNNAIAFKRVDVIGMDFDFTLCGYTHAMEQLIYDLAKEYLVDSLGYPEALKAREYDPDFAIRGLAIDMEKGLLCKLSYIYQIAIRSVFRGRKNLSKEEVLALYSDSAHVSPTYRDQQMKPLNDIFSLSEACLLADVFDHLIEQNMRHDPRAVVEDIVKAITNVHVSGKMHSTVIADPAVYIQASPNLRVTLQRFRDVGKQLFLCSNSDYNYVSGGLQYLLGDDWRDFFDVVIVSAGKPGFYSSNRPFRQVSQSTGKIRWTQVTKLEKGKVYSHGSMQALTELTGWKGPRVLYMGDSLWADLVDARRQKGWRTGAVIRELETELQVQQSPLYQGHAQKVIAVTDLLRLVQEEMERSRGTGGGDEGEEGDRGYVPPSFKYMEEEEDTRILGFLEKLLREINTEMSTMFNPQFGSVFRAEGEPTLFSFSLRRYSDLYTSRLENLRFYSPTHRFYPQRGISNPHDPHIPAFIRPTNTTSDDNEE